MPCPSCHREPPAGSHYCNHCGTALALACPRCGHVAPPASRFCNACGASLGEAPVSAAPEPPPGVRRDPRSYTPPHLAHKILTTRSSLEGERKHVTVLFADLADSTRLAERLDPEEMHSIMDRCFERILEPVHRYEGTINQFTGDGVMALFGAPIALEDAPRRAVVAALGIQRALRSLSAEVKARHGVELQMRIGIHSGPVVVGRIGDDLRMDYTAVGDTTHLADRLQKLAAPGSVLISEATEHLVSGFFEVRDLGGLGAKGIAEPVHAYEVLAERPARTRLEAVAEGGLTPLVGREHELAALEAAFRSCQRGSGRMVLLVGEAGIGKSRLLYEFRRRLGEAPHLWVEGRCASFGRDTPFYPIVDALRRLFGIEEQDDDRAALEKLLYREAELRLGEETAWTVPFVRHMLSLPAGDARVAELDAATRRSETFRALQARLLRAAQNQPIVLVIEDLHWIDAASEEFLGFLTECVASARVLLVFTYRPGYRQPFGDHSYQIRIALQPLTDEEMGSMAARILAGSELPPELHELIARKAEGNPFFVEEVTRSLLEDGSLRVEQGQVRLTRRIQDVSVPDRIQDVLMARIDRLEEEPKHAIQMASVIGREFALRLLQRVSEAGERLPTVVEELRTLELIHQKALYPELAFMFKHALTHEVAYQSMLLQRRKALHALVAAAIEELYSDRLTEHYEALAHHYALAQDWTRASSYHERAAEKALDAFANQAAAEHFRKALELGERSEGGLPPERRRRLEAGLGLASFILSDFRASGDAYARAAEACEAPAERALELARSGYSYLWAHDYERAHETTGRALELAREHRSPAAECVALVAIDEQEGVEGKRRDASRAERALALAEESGEPEALVRACTQLGQAAEWTGHFAIAARYCQRALGIAQRARLTHLIVVPQWFLGLSLCGMGKYGRALELLQEALETCDRIGDRAFKTRLLNSLGWCLAEVGCDLEASVYNQRATSAAREMVRLDLVAGAPELYANAAVNLAGNRIDQGAIDEALELLEPLDRELSKPGDPWMRWRYALHVHDALARLALARQDPDEALRRTQLEIEGARRYGARKIEARARELRARAHLAAEDPSRAEQALEAALHVASQIGYPPVLWRGEALRGELARRRGHEGEARGHFGEAQRRIGGLAASLPGELQGRFLALGERLVEHPLAPFC